MRRSDESIFIYLLFWKQYRNIIIICQAMISLMWREGVCSNTEYIESSILQISPTKIRDGRAGGINALSRNPNIPVTDAWLEIASPR